MHTESGHRIIGSFVDRLGHAVDLLYGRCVHLLYNPDAGLRRC